MSAECSTGACDVSSGGSHVPSGKGCPCGTEGCCGTDPMECAQGMWTCAFFQALKEVQVEILKGKIQKAWGAKMEKAADAALEAHGTQWQSMLAAARAKAEFQERLRSLWQEGK